MLTDLRLLSHQLAAPAFDHPGQLVSWMGAMQAQDRQMVKWALGMRLKTPVLRKVENALQQGKIIRMHILRPTWHLVAAEDARWMLKLSGGHIKAANESLARSGKLGIEKEHYHRCNRLLEKILEGKKYLTKQEISDELKKVGLPADAHRLNCFLLQAEAEGILCNGPDKEKKHTYALLEERIPPVKGITVEEALATLAGKYFQSHSPASLQDFIWWSGLTVTQAKQAIRLISSQLIQEKWNPSLFFIHRSCNHTALSADTLHFLPPYDEYLIGYKDRSAVIDPVHYRKAFTNYGIFYPVILHNGIVTGNWNKRISTEPVETAVSFFDTPYELDPAQIEEAANRYRKFIQ